MSEDPPNKRLAGRAEELLADIRAELQQRPADGTLRTAVERMKLAFASVWIAFAIGQLKQVTIRHDGDGDGDGRGDGDGVSS